jgi:type IV pilus assembly protein PilM
MPSLSALKPNLNLNVSLGRRRGADVVGLDIQPGYVAAVQAHVNGGIVVERAAGAPLPGDVVREGEVLDERELGEQLRALFQDAQLGRRVRVGLANQRTVLRTFDLPPVTDRKELDAAVRFQAEDQVPMPLASAVLDYHSLGVFDTPNGPRQRVIVVAAQREMVERLLRAVQHAGLRPEGIDLSAFALIRSLHRLGAGLSGAIPAGEGSSVDHGHEAEGARARRDERVLYLNIGGLTNMAIAEGAICRFTRVVGGGLEAMASEIAERRGIPLVEARALLATFELPLPGAHQPTSSPAASSPEASVAAALTAERAGDEEPGDAAAKTPRLPDPEAVETWALAQDPGAQPAQADDATGTTHAIHLDIPDEPAPAAAPEPPADPDVRMVLENGVREIVGEVRNSLDFHRSQEGGGEVLSVVLSGPALEMKGFCEAIEADLGMPVRCEAVRFAADTGAESHDGAHVSVHRLAIATGLATEEASR